MPCALHVFRELQRLLRHVHPRYFDHAGLKFVFRIDRIGCYRSVLCGKDINCNYRVSVGAEPSGRGSSPSRSCQELGVPSLPAPLFPEGPRRAKIFIPARAPSCVVAESCQIVSESEFRLVSRARGPWISVLVSPPLPEACLLDEKASEFLRQTPHTAGPRSVTRGSKIVAPRAKRAGKLSALRITKHKSSEMIFLIPLGGLEGREARRPLPPWIVAFSTPCIMQEYEKSPRSRPWGMVCKSQQCIVYQHDGGMHCMRACSALPIHSALLFLTSRILFLTSRILRWDFGGSLLGRGWRHRRLRARPDP